MSAKRLAGQIKAVLSGLLLVGIVVLVILQAPKESDCYLYGHELARISTIWVVLASMVLGLVVIALAKMLVRGLGVMRKTAPVARLDKLEKRVAKQEKTGE